VSSATPDVSDDLPAGASRRLDLPRRTGRRLWVRVLDFLVLLVVCAVLYVAFIGVPDPVTRRLLQPQEDAAYALDVRHLRYNPLRGLVAQDLRVYRRKVIGPAVLEVERAVLDVSPVKALLRKPWMDSVLLDTGVIRPQMMAGRETAGGFSLADLERLGPQAMRVAVRNLDVLGVTVVSLEGRLRGDHGQLTLARGAVTLKQGERDMAFRGQVSLSAASGLTGEGTADGDPHVLNPLFAALHVPAAESIVNDFAFPVAAPQWEWSCAVPIDRPGDFLLKFQFSMENPEYRGVAALRADAEVELSSVAGMFMAQVRPLVIVRDEGTGRGGLVIRYGGGRFTLEYDAMSGLDPRAVSTMIGVLTNECSNVFRFREPYHVESHGFVNLRDHSGTRLSAHCGFGSIGLGAHDLRDCAFRYRLDGRTNRLDDVRGGWFGGELTGWAEWVPQVGASSTSYRAQLELRGADFERVVSALDAQPREYAGRLSGKIQLAGLTGAHNRDSMKGGGEMRISRGRLFLLPIFGGLTEYLSWAIPGFDDVLGQTDAKANFTIADGRIASDEVLIEGDVLSLKGRGSYALEDALDFDVQLTFLRSHTLVSKLLRVPTYLLSKLFEFKLAGTRQAPHWYPVNFSKEVWQQRVGVGKASEAGDEGDRGWRFWLWPRGKGSSKAEETP